MDQLAQGKLGRKGMNTIVFIKKQQVPFGRKVTYGRIVVAHRTKKVDQHRTRLTVGGDRIEYPYEVGTPTADMTTAKLYGTLSSPPQWQNYLQQTSVIFT